MAMHRIDAVKKLDGDEYKEALKILVQEATDKRHLTLQSGAPSHGHLQWAAAVVLALRLKYKL